MNVNPGELNKRIKIIKLRSKPNARGFGERSEEVVRETWAKFTRKSIKQIMEAKEELSDIDARFLVRYTKVPIEKGMYVLYKGTYYHIEYANNYGDSNEYIEIMTSVGMK